MIRIRVTGDKAVQVGLARTAADLDRPVPALRQVAADLTRTAARLAAKRTGRLSRGNRATVATSTARVTNRVKYAGYQEGGTRYMNAHPFMRPAARLTDPTPAFDDYADRTLRKHL
ncbi:hypothetical protein GMA5_10 [Gordonia phage GMA5]|uniref:Uncharacterized protein n=1 Tax=Gordonia phage GMA5 TaxID=1647472 RepID=A0A0K0MWS3_9CAUD|nr:hypothetical protein BH786_gp10 [Gordonia phage GMA5]AKI28624.1 hypothetical protein GMA5_10 [Gordonia phage GMA5]